MPGPAAKEAPQYRKASPEELKHIVEHHIQVWVSTQDPTACVTIIGECDEEGCPLDVPCCRYCKRPPC